MREGEAGIATSCVQLAGIGIKQTWFSHLLRSQRHSRWLEQGKVTAPRLRLGNALRHRVGLRGCPGVRSWTDDPCGSSHSHSGYSVILLRVCGSTRIHLFPWRFSSFQSCLLPPSRWRDQDSRKGRDSGVRELRICPRAVASPDYAVTS